MFTILVGRAVTAFLGLGQRPRWKPRPRLRREPRTGCRRRSCGSAAASVVGDKEDNTDKTHGMVKAVDSKSTTSQSQSKAVEAEKSRWINRGKAAEHSCDTPPYPPPSQIQLKTTISQLAQHPWQRRKRKPRPLQKRAALKVAGRGREIEKNKKSKTPVKSTIQDVIASLVQDGLPLKMEASSIKVELKENTGTSDAGIVAMTDPLTPTNLTGTQHESRQKP